jgi:superoxide dismutase
MRLHHDKHHQANVDKANDALQGTEFDGKPVEEGFANLWLLPADRETRVPQQRWRPRQPFAVLGVDEPKRWRRTDR